MNYIKNFNDFLNEKQSIEKKIVIAYHGTPHGEFDKFSMRKRGSGADQSGFGDYGKGFYFTPHKSDAIGYAYGLTKANIGDKPCLYTVELIMNKPFTFDKLTQFTRMIHPLMKKYGMLNIPEEEYQKIYSDLNTTEEEIDFIRDIEDSMGDNWGDWNFQKQLKSNGYDSIINQNGSEYIVFSTRQIKIIQKEMLNPADAPAPVEDIVINKDKNEVEVEAGNNDDEIEFPFN